MFNQKNIFFLSIFMLHLSLGARHSFFNDSFYHRDTFCFGSFLKPVGSSFGKRNFNNLYYDDKKQEWRWGRFRFGCTISYLPSEQPAGQFQEQQKAERSTSESSESFPRLKNFFRTIFNRTTPTPPAENPNAHLYCGCPKRKLPRTEQIQKTAEQLPQKQTIEPQKNIEGLLQEQNAYEYETNQLCTLRESLLEEPYYYVDYQGTLARNECRAGAIEELLDGKTQKFSQSFSLSEEAHSTIQQYTLCKEKYIECIGNTLQQVLHTEIINLIGLSKRVEDSVLRKFIITVADITADGNHSGLLHGVVQALDFAWYLTDASINCVTQVYVEVVKKSMSYAAAATEGAILAAYDIPQVILNIKPLTKNFLTTIGLLLCSIPPIDDDGNITMEQIIFSKECFHQVADPLIAHCTDFYKNAKPEDYLREGVRFVAFGKFTNLLVGAAGSFIQEVEATYMPVIREKISSITSPSCIATCPESLSVKIAGELLEETYEFSRLNRLYSQSENAGVKVIPDAGKTTVGVRPGKEVVLRVPVKESSKGLIKDMIEIRKDMLRHIFSNKHIKDGLRNLGKTDLELLEIATKIIIELDAAGKLFAKDNRISFILNGHKMTVTCYIIENEMKNMDLFVGHSSRILGNAIEYTNECI